MSMLSLIFFAACKKNDFKEPTATEKNSTKPFSGGGITPESLSSTNVMIFGGGPFYTGGTAVMNDLRASGFTTVTLWSIHVDGTTGDLTLNDQKVVSNGVYVGNASWPGQLATLKQAPTSVTRIEVSVGSGGVNDFHNIQSLIAAQGTGTSSILYKNFNALKAATGAEAVDLDDEDLFNASTTTQFSVMCGNLGMKVTLCPYNNQTYWQNVLSQTNSQLPGTIDAIYLQCYDGGVFNNPATWNGYFSSSGLHVTPGLWSIHGVNCNDAGGDNPSSVQTKFTNWKNSTTLSGGFMWLYDDIQHCSSQGNSAQYASAIKNALGGGGTNPGVVFYQDINFGGTSTQPIPAGNYTLAQLQSYGFIDNWTSSVTIPAGWSITMYTNDNFGGTSWALSSSNADFTQLVPNANDVVTSVKIQATASSNNSVSMNGNNQYLDAGTFNLNGPALTLEGWVNVSSFKTTSPYISTIMGIEVSGTNVGLLRIGDATLANNKVQFVLGTGGASSNKLASNTALATNTWYHIAATYDGATMKIYINGNLDASMSVSGAIVANGSFQISRSYDNTRGLNGLADELRVWNVARTQAQIQANTCSVSQTSSGLLSYWKLNEGTGTITADATGLGHTASLINGVTWSTNKPCQ